MAMEKTLKEYITELMKVIEDNDVLKAKMLQTEILAVLGSEFKDLQRGLSNYQYASFYTEGFSNEVEKIKNTTDFIGDARILKKRLEIELEKMGDSKMEEQVEQEKDLKIFISHSSKDADYVLAFVELLETLNVPEDRIICSSVPPYCIPLGNKVYNWLVSQFQHSSLHVFYVLSDNYYKSPASLNEMGATWALKHKWDGILLPGFEFEDIKGCIDKTQISIKLDDTDKRMLNYQLGLLKNKIAKEFGLNLINEAIWERKRDEFLDKIDHINEKKVCENS